MPLVRLSEAPPYLKLFIHGHTGVGKTWLAASAQDVPAMCPVLFIDVDKGTLSIRHRTDLWTWRIDSYPELNDVFNGPILAYEEFRTEHFGPMPDEPFKTIIVDGFAELYRLNMEFEMEQLLKRHPDRDPYVPDRREYGRVRARTLKLLRRCRDTDVHVIVTCASRYDKDYDELMVNMPNVAGRLATDVGDYFDIMGYMAVSLEKGGERTRKLIVQPSRRIRAKDRAGLGTDVLDNPTMTDIYNRCTHIQA